LPKKEGVAAPPLLEGWEERVNQTTQRSYDKAAGPGCVVVQLDSRALEMPFDRRTQSLFEGNRRRPKPSRGSCLGVRLGDDACNGFAIPLSNGRAIPALNYFPLKS
jgi:hypothetical protein